MVQGDRLPAFRQCLAQFEFGLVWQQGTGNNCRAWCTFPTHNHSLRSTHKLVGILAENLPAGRRNLWRIIIRLHFRKQNKLGGIIDIGWQTQRLDQTGITLLRCLQTILPDRTPSQMHLEAVLGQPAQSQNSLFKRSVTALCIMLGRAIMIETNPQNQAVGILFL